MQGPIRSNSAIRITTLLTWTRLPFHRPSSFEVGCRKSALGSHPFQLQGKDGSLRRADSSALLSSDPRAFHSIGGGGSRILPRDREQLSLPEKPDGSLHRGLRQSRALSHLLEAQRYDLMACSYTLPPHMEIHKKCRGPVFMLGEIAHEDVKDVRVQGKLHG